MRQSLAIFFALLCLASAPATAGEECFADWSEAAPIVRKEGLATVESLSGQARDKLDGEIVKTTLCQERGSYVFRLIVRRANGQLKSVTLDARRPFGR